MNLRDAALRAAVLKALADEIAATQLVAKAEAREGFEAAGASQAAAVLPDGTKVATVSLAGGGGQTASVTDEGAFLAWVAREHPGETQTVVRPEYRKKLLDAAKEAGRPLDPATGEIVPGITMRDTTPYVSVRFRPGGADAIADAWAAGDLKDVSVVRPRAVTVAPADGGARHRSPTRAVDPDNDHRFDMAGVDGYGL